VTLAVAACLTGCTATPQPAAPAGDRPAVPMHAGAVPNGPIAFGRIDARLGDFTLWTALADGSHQRRLTTTRAFSPDWRPDGSGLVFDYPDGLDEHIAGIGRDGSHLTQLTSGAGIQEAARYSPDGRHIVFDASDRHPDDPGFATDIEMMDADGSHRRRLTHGAFDVEPGFSPDGRFVVFGRIVDPAVPPNFNQHEAVYVVRTDGTGLHQVVAPRPALEHPRWSPDGRLLTFNIAPESSGAPGAGSVFSLRPDGRGLRVLRAASRAWSFANAVWSPDGRRLLVVCHRAAADVDCLCQVNPRTGRLRVVVTTLSDRPVDYPAWGPAPD
jgi:Tol biopolymer transport system component